MKDTDWKILYELYMTPNITKVAEKLFMAQPTLTKRLQYIEEELCERLGTKVKIKNNKIEISFVNGNDLNRLLEIMNLETRR